MKKAKYKLTIVAIVASLVGVILACVLFNSIIKRSTFNALEKSMQVVTNIAATSVKGQVDSYKKYAVNLANNEILTQDIPELGTWSEAGLTRMQTLKLVVEQKEQIEEAMGVEILILNEEGIEIENGNDYSTDKYFESARDTGSPYISKIVKRDGRSELNVGAPIIKEGEFKGVICYVIEASNFFSFIKDIHIGQNGDIFVLDPNMNVIESSLGENDRETTSLFDIIQFDKGVNLDDTNSFVPCTIDGKESYFSTSSNEINDNWTIGVTIHGSDFLSMLNYYMIAIVVVTIAILAISMLSVLAINRKAIKHLEEGIVTQLSEQAMLTKCVSTLHSGKDPIASIRRLLTMTVDYYKANRAAIYEISSETGNMNLTQEVSAYLYNDSNILKPLNSIKMLDLESNLLKDDCLGAYHWKNEEGEIFFDMRHIPIFEKKDEKGNMIVFITNSEYKLVGLISVENARENADKIYILRELSKFVSDFIRKDELIEKLHWLTYYDLLTRSKSRYSYNKAMNIMMKSDIESLGVLHVDIDGLRAINETRGAKSGDEIIMKLSDIMCEVFGNDVYRIDGDEFAVLRKNLSERDFEEHIGILKEKLNKEESFKVNYGYTWNKIDGEIFDKSKKCNQNYDSILSSNLERELESGKYEVFLQPQINLVDNDCTSAEALIRRRDSKGNIQSPGTFVPFYEKEGMIAKIDFFVFQKVCRTLKEWRDKGFTKNITIAVNFSRISVLEEGLVDKLNSICKVYDVDKSRLVIEITESASKSGDENVAKIVEELKINDFKVSLDDFGTGFSNLSTLKSTNFDEIKIDMSLTKDIDIDVKAQQLAKVALKICDEFPGMKSVAEGIETEEQFNILKKYNCDKGQGFYFDKPMPIDCFGIKYMASNA